MKETSDVRLARIEQGMVHIHGKIDRNHTEIMNALGPVQGHGEDLIMLKRDRYWVFSIITFLGGLFGYHAARH